MCARRAPWTQWINGAIGVFGLFLVLGACVSLGWSAPPRYTGGVLLAVNADERTVSVKTTKGEFDLTLGDNVSITLDGKKAALTDLAAGQRVTIGADHDSREILSIKARAAAIEADAPEPKTPKKSKPAAKSNKNRNDSAQEQEETTATGLMDNRRPSKRSNRGGDSASTNETDWPQWRGANQDGIARGIELRIPWPNNGPKRRWNERIGQGYAGIAVVGNRLFTMEMASGRENVLCMDTTTGERVWTHAYAGAFSNSFGNGPRSTPTVDGKRVYTWGATGILHCLDADTGKVHWAKDLLRDFGAPNLEWGISASPLVVDDKVLVHPGGRNGAIAAFDKQSGNIIWRAHGDAASYATPLLVEVGSTSAVVFFTASGLLGLDPRKRGEELFRFNWQTQYNCNIATPIFHDNRLFISSGYGTGCACVEWSARGRGGVREIYRNKIMKNHFSTCVLHGKHLYGFNDAILTCMDFNTGREQWRQRGFEKGSLTIADDHLIILGEHGNLALAKCNPRRYEEVSRFQPLNGKCWTVPTVAQGALFVRNEQTIQCYDIAKD